MITYSKKKPGKHRISTGLSLALQKQDVFTTDTDDSSKKDASSVKRKPLQETTNIQKPLKQKRLKKQDIPKPKITVYHDDPVPVTQNEPEWVITPRKLFRSDSEDSDELILSKATVCRM